MLALSSEAQGKNTIDKNATMMTTVNTIINNEQIMMYFNGERCALKKYWL